MSNKTQLQINNTALDALITRVNAAKDVAASLPEAGGGTSGGSKTVSITIQTTPKIVYGFDANGTVLAVTSGTYDFLAGIVACTSVGVGASGGNFTMAGNSLYRFTEDGGVLRYSDGSDD